MTFYLNTNIMSIIDSLEITEKCREESKHHMYFLRLMIITGSILCVFFSVIGVYSVFCFLFDSGIIHL